MIASLLDICDYFWLENICVLSCTEGHDASPVYAHGIAILDVYLVMRGLNT